MKVLLLHNRYRQYGGEDAVVAAETQMLRNNGLTVFEARFDNDADPEHPWLHNARLALDSAWSSRSYRFVADLCEKYRPDVAHVHNFWLQLSPSVHAACQSARVPTVQTLHNYRLLCTNAQLLRQGKVCEDCVGKIPWRGVVRRCYGDSYLRSAATARMIVLNSRRKTWQRDVDAFVVMSEHARSRFAAGGLPVDRIFVKPNFMEDPGPPRSKPSASNIVLYLGRLSVEKGLTHLVSAWMSLRQLGRLLVVGDGPDRQALERQAKDLGFSESEVSFLGWKEPFEVHRLLAGARALVLPSLGYEGGGCPMSLVEAFAFGRPVVISDLGGMREIVHDSVNGLRVRPGDDAELGRALRSVLTDGDLADRLGEGARMHYLSQHSPETNCTMLLNIYRFAIQRKLGNTWPNPTPSGSSS